MLKLSLNALRHYNGRNGEKAFIAYKGQIYDVTDLYKDGEHNSCIAGNDLTDILEMMPHGDDVVARYPVVGILEMH